MENLRESMPVRSFRFLSLRGHLFELIFLSDRVDSCILFCCRFSQWLIAELHPFVPFSGRSETDKGNFLKKSENLVSHFHGKILSSSLE